MSRSQQVHPDQNHGAVPVYQLLSALPVAGRLDGAYLAALRRALMLTEDLHRQVVVVSHDYCPRPLENLRQTPEGQKLSAQAALLNVYDLLQDIDRQALRPQETNLPIAPGWKLERLAGKNALIARLDGQVIMYAALSQDGRQLNFINWITAEVTVRRDIYDEIGFLSVTEFLEPQSARTLSRVYYRPDHTVALTETYGLLDGQEVITSCNLMDRQGFTTRRLSVFDEVVAWALLSYFQCHQIRALLLAENPGFYQRFFIEIRKQPQFADLKLICVLHNCHTIDPAATLTGALGMNYRFLDDKRQRPDMVVTLSECQRQDLQRRFAHLAPCLKVIPNCPASAAEQSADEPPPGLTSRERCRIVFVGRLCPQKQPLLALEVFRLVLRQVPEARLHIYGTGDLEAQVTGKIQSAGLASQVTMHGYEPDISQIYRKAAVMLATSKQEGRPQVQEEALSFGVPVVSTDCNYGPADLIRDGVNGYLVPMDSAAAESAPVGGQGRHTAASLAQMLAERVVRLLTDDGLWQRMSEAARSGQTVSRSKVAEEWRELFSQLSHLSHFGAEGELHDSAESEAGFAFTAS